MYYIKNLQKKERAWNVPEWCIATVAVKNAITGQT